MDYPNNTIKSLKAEHLHNNIHSLHIIASEDIVSELIKRANELRANKFNNPVELHTDEQNVLNTALKSLEPAY